MPDKPSVPRRCLRCDHLFPSRGPENRICKPCRHLVEVEASPEPVYVVALWPRTTA